MAAFLFARVRPAARRRSENFWGNFIAPKQKRATIPSTEREEKTFWIPKAHIRWTGPAAWALCASRAFVFLLLQADEPLRLIKRDDVKVRLDSSLPRKRLMGA